MKKYSFHPGKGYHRPGVFYAFHKVEGITYQPPTPASRLSRPGADDLKETALLGVYVTSKERREKRGARG
jgi:hypothetical protein